MSERRAAVLGGGPAARQVALGEATDFCRQQGRVVGMTSAGFVGNPYYSPYGPTGFTAIFQCNPPGTVMPPQAPFETAPGPAP